MEHALETIGVFGGILVSLLALFVPITVGIVMAQRLIGPQRLRRWLGGSNLVTALAKGTALGALTPFCGCSTIPLLLGLLKANVRFAAVTAFLLASPLLNPYVVAVVTLLFGWQVTVAYASVAVAATAVIATVWEALALDRYVTVDGYEPARTRGVSSVPATVAAARPQSTAMPEREAAEAAPWRGVRPEATAAWHEALGLLRPMLVPLLAGVGVGALIYGAVPEGALASVLGTGSALTLPLAAVLGMPLYLRGEAAFPIGAALLAAGVGPGPMFAMVIGGMGASLPEVVMLSAIFSRRLLAAFLLAIFLMAVTGGLLIPLVM